MAIQQIDGQQQVKGNSIDTAQLAVTAVTPDTYGDATHVPQLTVGADGRATNVTEVLIAGVTPSGTAGGDLSGSYPNPSVVDDSHAHTSDTLTFNKSFALTGDITPTQIAATTNDYNPTGLATAAVLRLSTDASRNLTGLQSGADGRIIIIANVGSFNLVLKDENASSSAANRFALTADVTLTPDTVVLLQYDSTSSRWRVIGGTGSGGGGLPPDADYGDVTVSSSGTVWTIDNGVVSFSKMQAITDGKLLGASGGTAVEEITVSTGLLLSSNNLSSTITQYTDELAQDAVGNNVGAGLTYDDTAGSISATGGALVVNVDTTPVGNVGAGEDTLITYTVPANTLDTNGQYLHFVASGIFAASLNTKRVKAYFGSAVLIDTGALAITAAGNWLVDAYIIRTGATTQRCVARFISDETALNAEATYVDATETLSGTIILKCTGTATADNDIVEKFDLLEKGGGTGSGGSNTAIGARVYNNANISISDSSLTKLTFNSETYDTNSIHDTGSNTGRLTCNTTGYYVITSNVEFDNNVTGRRLVDIILNNTTVIARAQQNAVAGAGNNQMLVTTTYHLVATDYVETEVLQNSGGSLNVLATTDYSPVFMMQMIAAG